MRKVLYILGQLSDEDVDWLARGGRRRRVATGEVLIVQGRPIRSVFFLLDGRMAVDIEGVGQVAELGVGEIMGEMSLVDSRPPSASVRAIEAALALEVDQDLIRDRLRDDLGFSARFHKAIATFLSDRMRATVQSLGYGRLGGDGLNQDEEMADELDLNVLDNVHLAGARFERMLKRLAGAA
ncbi:MAG: cyclic nucleotide-binding domain-containing protein [Alphaproteobacteria bacterium]|nr:cyclic nucleotide-binding domain-containing protein [Alphaproteobacteria bacterium]MBF0372208.1 cyclic nucleotide-binding domain-containing protein [Alphaproteobacteria bacterium]